MSDTAKVVSSMKWVKPCLPISYKVNFSLKPTFDEQIQEKLIISTF